MISSFLPHEMMLSESENPNNTRLKPLSVTIYNKKMGGVDDVDKVLKPLASIRKSLKWYKKVFFHIWDLVLYNSFRVYKILHPSSSRRYKDFLEAVIAEIFEKFPSAPPMIGRRPSTERNVRLCGSHFPIQVVSGSHNQKGRCHYCQLQGLRNTSSFKCESCGKWLCIRGAISCFKKFHTERHLPKKIVSASIPSVMENEMEENDEMQEGEEDELLDL